MNRVQADDKLPEPGKKRESFNTRRNARDISARSEWPGLQRRSDGGGTAQQDLSCDAGRAPNPFVDPITFAKWVKRAQDEAEKAVQSEKQKAGR